MNETVAKIMNSLESGGNTDLATTLQPSMQPTMQPTIINAEELHEKDAYAAVFLNIFLIICVLMAYFIKENKLYFLPER